jgi:hypothetical protein
MSWITDGFVDGLRWRTEFRDSPPDMPVGMGTGSGEDARDHRDPRAPGDRLDDAPPRGRVLRVPHPTRFA